MWEKIGDLPLHPLVVHGPVILVPLLALIAVVFAVVPRWRSQVWWAALLLALAAPGAAFAAVQSGKAFKKALGSNEAIERHQDFGTNVLYASSALAVVTVALLFLEYSRRRAIASARSDATTAEPAGEGARDSAPLEESGSHVVARSTHKSTPPRALSVVLSVLIVALSAVALYYVVRAGHSGAEMRWKDVIPD